MVHLRNRSREAKSLLFDCDDEFKVPLPCAQGDSIRVVGCYKHMGTVADATDQMARGETKQTQKNNADAATLARVWKENLLSVRVRVKVVRAMVQGVFSLQQRGQLCQKSIIAAAHFQLGAKHILL